MQIRCKGPLPRDSDLKIFLIFVHETLEELPLDGDHAVDLLLERAPGDQLQNLDVLVLADAVDAVRRLVLLGRVPPPVVVDDHRGGRQVDADAAGQERAAEDLELRVRLEVLDHFAAVLRLPVRVTWPILASVR